MNKRTASILAIVGAVMLGAGCLLPWATITTGFGSASVNGIEGDGAIIIGIAVVIGIIAFAAIERPNRAAPVVVMAGAGLALLVLLLDYSDLTRRLEDAASSVARASIGTGLYLCIAGAIVAIVGAAFMLWPTKTTAEPALAAWGAGQQSGPEPVPANWGQPPADPSPQDTLDLK